MEPQETKLLTTLYDLMQSWFEDQNTNWYDRSLDFKKMYKILKLHHQAFKVALGIPVPKTIEEKVAQAAFYVESGVEYKIEYKLFQDREFHVVDSQGNERDIDFYTIPADAYFLRTHRL